MAKAWSKTVETRAAEKVAALAPRPVADGVQPLNAGYFTLERMRMEPRAREAGQTRKVFEHGR